jgi:hypothetical protein
VEGARFTLLPAWEKGLRRLVEGETWFLKVVGRSVEYAGLSMEMCLFVKKVVSMSSLSLREDF